MTLSRPRPILTAILALAAGLLPTPVEAARPVLLVRADPVVELFGIVFRLAGNPEYGTPADGSAARTAIDAHFAPFRDHAAVQLARQLRSERGISYDGVISLANHIHNVRNFALAAPLDPWPEHLDRRWDAASVGQFIAALGSFVQDTGYLAWWDTQRESHAALCVPLLDGIVQTLDLPWFHRRLGLTIEGTLEVIVSPVAGASAYSSLLVTREDETTTHVILGALGDTFEGDAHRIAIETIVHELCHPTVNPTVDGLLDRFEPARAPLYPPMALAMEEQGYADWRIVLREVFVRLYTRLWITEHRGHGAAQEYGDDQVARGFGLVEVLAARLPEAFAGKRNPDLDDFIESCVPTVLEQAEFLRTKIAPHRPRVVSVEPGISATGLPAGPCTVRITFDRPMEPGYTMMKLAAPFPRVTGKPRWNDARTVFSIDLTLEAGVRYELGVNGPGVGQFRGAEPVHAGRGAPIIPFRIVLSTEPTVVAVGGVPEVVSISPAADAKGVASGRTALRIEFDRPMAASYSVTGGGESFPKVVGAARWNEERTVFTLPVELAPGRKYEFGVNGPGNTGFRAEGGEPAEAVWVVFSTGG